MKKSEFLKKALAKKKPSGVPKPSMAEDVPVLSPFVDSDYWYLLKKIGWKPDVPTTSPLSSVTVPKGFVTDFASVPKVFFSALPPIGRYTYAAILHDYLYWEQTCERAEADTVLKLCMQEMKVPSAKVLAIYNAVRVGGSSAWKNNGKLKAKGEKRTLTKFPTDPMTSWDDWKKDPKNFT